MKAKAINIGGVAGGRIKSFIERIERLEQEKAALSKLDAEKRREADELLDLYKTSIGMV